MKEQFTLANYEHKSKQLTDLSTKVHDIKISIEGVHEEHKKEVADLLAEEAEHSKQKEQLLKQIEEDLKKTHELQLKKEQAAEEEKERRILEEAEEMSMKG